MAVGAHVGVDFYRGVRHGENSTVNSLEGRMREADVGSQSVDTIKLNFQISVRPFMDIARVDVKLALKQRPACKMLDGRRQARQEAVPAAPRHSLRGG